MIDVSNRVFSNVETYVKQSYPNVNCQNTLTMSDPTFPAMAVRQIDMSEAVDNLDGGSTDQEFAVNSSVEIQVYSNKSITEARSVINAACTAMRGMGYARRYGPSEVQDITAPNMYRMVARFTRIVHSLSELPKFPTTTTPNSQSS